jgi:hypothetical protein
VLNASVVTSIGFGEYGYALASAAASATQHCAQFPALYPRTCMTPCSYYFHCLSTDVPWFHSVYPNASDFARHAHDIKPQGTGGAPVTCGPQHVTCIIQLLTPLPCLSPPPGLFGFDSFPQSKAEAEGSVRAYVAQRQRHYKVLHPACIAGVCVHHHPVYLHRQPPCTTQQPVTRACVRDGRRRCSPATDITGACAA